MTHSVVYNNRPAPLPVREESVKIREERYREEVENPAGKQDRQFYAALLEERKYLRLCWPPKQMTIAEESDIIWEKMICHVVSPDNGMVPLEFMKKIVKVVEYIQKQKELNGGKVKCNCLSMGDKPLVWPCSILNIIYEQFGWSPRIPTVPCNTLSEDHLKKFLQEMAFEQYSVIFDLFRYINTIIIPSISNRGPDEHNPHKDLLKRFEEDQMKFYGRPGVFSCELIQSVKAVMDTLFAMIEARNLFPETFSIPKDLPNGSVEPFPPSERAFQNGEDEEKWKPWRDFPTNLINKLRQLRSLMVLYSPRTLLPRLDMLRLQTLHLEEADKIDLPITFPKGCKLPNLISLKLCFTRLIIEGFEKKAMPSVEEVELSKVEVKNPKWIESDWGEGVKNLHIEFHRLSEKFLINTSKIKSLLLKNIEAIPNVSDTASLSQCERIDLTFSTKIKITENLGKLPNLNYLRFRSIRGIEMGKWHPDLPKLLHLEIGKCKGAIDLLEWTSPLLETVVIEGDNSPLRLPQWERLKTLEIQGCSVPSETLDRIESLVTLKHLKMVKSTFGKKITGLQLLSSLETIHLGGLNREIFFMPRWDTVNEIVLVQFRLQQIQGSRAAKKVTLINCDADPWPVPFGSDLYPSASELVCSFASPAFEEQPLTMPYLKLKKGVTVENSYPINKLTVGSVDIDSWVPKMGRSEGSLQELTSHPDFNKVESFERCRYRINTVVMESFFALRHLTLTGSVFEGGLPELKNSSHLETIHLGGVRGGKQLYSMPRWDFASLKKIVLRDFHLQEIGGSATASEVSFVNCNLVWPPVFGPQFPSVLRLYLEAPAENFEPIPHLKIGRVVELESDYLVKNLSIV